MTNSTKTTTTNAATSSAKLSWNAGDIFAANFMFPTKHFNEGKELDALTEEEFSQFVIGLLEPVQPLTNDERVQLVKSTKSGNRLRLYYHTLNIIDSRVQIADEVSSQDCEDVKLRDKFDHVHMTVVDADHLVKDENDPVELPCELQAI